MYSKEDLKFASEFLERVEKKLSIMAPQIGGNFPYTNNHTGEWIPSGEGNSIDNWTNGYWPGICWLMYIKTGDEMYRKFAEECEEKLDEALLKFIGLHHDVGFMWSLSAVANYKITGNERSKARAFAAASVLASRFNSRGNFIRAWNFGQRVGVAIIDCMMNIPILDWATKYGKESDPRFSHVALAHADKVAETFIRPDGSVYHIIEFDGETGEILGFPDTQGYDENSSWSRGQAWAIYGFAMLYLNTGNKKYLDIAKKVAHYFIANMEPGKLPLVDFRAPAEPVMYDASAAAIAACGFIEIAKAVGEFEAPMYERAAMQLLRVLDEDCNYKEDECVLLQKNTGAYHLKGSIERPYIYGDYYLVEALMKLYGNDGRFNIHQIEEAE